MSVEFFILFQGRVCFLSNLHVSRIAIYSGIYGNYERLVSWGVTRISSPASFLFPHLSSLPVQGKKKKRGRSDFVNFGYNYRPPYAIYQGTSIPPGSKLCLL